MKFTSFIALVAIGAIGLVGVDRYQAHARAQADAVPVVAPKSRIVEDAPAAAPVDQAAGQRAECRQRCARVIGVPLRWKNALLADALLRGSDVLPSALPEYADGWRQRWGGL